MSFLPTSLEKAIPISIGVEEKRQQRARLTAPQQIRLIYSAGYVFHMQPVS